MVVAVALYCVVGAITIRNIEAVPKNRTLDIEFPITPRMKRQGYWIEREPMNRARRCVIAALKAIVQETNCSEHLMPTASGVKLLDECYREDIEAKRVTAGQKLQEHRIRHEHKKERERDYSQGHSVEIVSVRFEGEDIEWEYWSFMDSIVFCFTVITTIGYGNVAPQTFEGRLFVIFYGLVGVPFTMLAIANLGKFFASLLKAWIKPFIHCCRRCRARLRVRRPKDKDVMVDTNYSKIKGTDSNENVNDSESEDGDREKKEEEQEEDDDPNAMTDAIVLFIAFVIYIVLGSFMISSYEEDMDFFLAIYFNFVTLTTIGLGDLVPQRKEYLIVTLVYVAVGLALTTIAIEIAADYLKKLHYFGRKLDKVSNVKIWFGGQQLTMKQLVRNLGDQFNVDIDQLANLDLEQFVDNAIRVEAGELATLRQQDKPYMHTQYWRAVQGRLIFVDEELPPDHDSNANYSILTE
ncbi:unnamed protein product, partial [Mesorhabditis belari]|uniref:Potassium channel domain-containing protein n=1 Tax=Mesorhabditis belari TaxID=2138241 RepID=A0AAF3EQR0_9BILA